VLVFELKMFIGNLRDFALMPVSVVAAMIDLVSKGEREGSLFYRVLRWGAHSEEVLDAYSPIRDELQDRKVNPNYTVDAVVARLEGVLVREYEKGGTAATIKAALDRAIDQLHRETGKHRERAQTAVVKILDEGKRLTEGKTGKKDIRLYQNNRRSRDATSRRSHTCPPEPRRQRQSFAALGMTEAEMGASMRGGGTLVDSAVFRHLVIFHQTKAPIDQGLFVFVG
jgi:hypothetical protein